MFRMYAKELDAAETEAISRIKEWAIRCIGERDGLAASSPAVAPSTFWQDSSQISGYVRRMPSELFNTLRLHTYHFDGDTYAKSIASDPQGYQSNYDAMRKGLPERYWVAAPHACGEYGHLIDGRLVNDLVLKWQGIIRHLWHNGELPRLEKIQRPVILEIGAGYGGMAHHFMTMFPKALYIIVDLPESLLFSASYLTMIHGQQRVHLLDQSTEVASDSLGGCSFLMVPNFRSSCLSSWRFDLAINMESFHEMTKMQVAEYLEFLAPRTAILYSKNFDELYSSIDKVAVTPLLRQFFDLRPLTPWPTQRPGENGATRILRSVAGKMRRGIVSALYWPDRNWPDRKAPGRSKESSYLAVPKRGNEAKAWDGSAN